MSNKGKKFYIELEGMTEKEIIDEYLEAAKVDSGKAHFNAGQIAASVQSIFPLDGAHKLRKLTLMYFFAGMRFAKEHEDLYTYGYKKYDPKEEEVKVKREEEVIRDDTPSYFG